MNRDFNISALKHGVMIGGICAIISFILIMMGRETFLDFYAMTTLFAAITLIIAFGVKERQNHFNNEMKYIGAWLYAVIALFIYHNMIQLAYIGVCRVIDPGIQELIMNRTMEGMEMGLDVMDGLVEMDAAQVDELLDQAEIEIERSFTLSSLVYNSLSNFFLSVILGAISAIFIKKSKPDFAEE